MYITDESFWEFKKKLCTRTPEAMRCYLMAWTISFTKVLQIQHWLQMSPFSKPARPTLIETYMSSQMSSLVTVYEGYFLLPLAFLCSTRIFGNFGKTFSLKTFSLRMVCSFSLSINPHVLSLMSDYYSIHSKLFVRLILFQKRTKIFICMFFSWRHGTNSFLNLEASIKYHSAVS